MKLILTSFFLVLFSFSQAQNVKIFSEKKNEVYSIYASNMEFCPYSILLELDITNMIFSGGKQTLFVVPAITENFKIGELSINNATRGSKYSYKYKTAMGDVNKQDYEKDYVYDLPFLNGKSFNLFQGYNGNFSHQNEKALDFTMPEGTEVTAARDGIVIKVVQQNTESCPKEECKKNNNYIIIYHADGTFSNYVHLKYNGSKVKPGDIVKKGNVIALSGNTGWSSGPHLHFVCFKPDFEKWNSLETKFKTDDGNNIIYIKEKTTYTKSY